MSQTAWTAVVRPLRRASDPARGLDLPALPRLAVGRLETLLEVLEGGDRSQRAVWVDLSERDASTLDAWIGWLARTGRPLPGSAMSARRRAAWVAGLD